MSDQEEAVVATPFHCKLDNLVIDGSTSSHSYLAYARKGAAILAIKFGSPLDGVHFGVKGCTYIGGRVRSQRITNKIKDYLEQDDADAGNIATFEKKNENWAEPWPDVKFEKSDVKRASTQTGAFIRGTLKNDPEALLDQFENGAVANKFADFLVTTCGGADNLLFSRDDLVGFIQEVYGPPAKAMRASIQAEKEVMDASSTAESIGVFGFQSALMKELFEQKMTDHTPVPHPIVADQTPYDKLSPSDQDAANGEDAALEQQPDNHDQHEEPHDDE